MMRFKQAGIVLLGLCAAGTVLAHAAEHVTLRNGFEMDCVRREVVDGRLRLYMTGSMAGSDNYIEVAPDAIVRVEKIADAPVVPAQDAILAAPAVTAVAIKTAVLTREEMHTMLSNAGTQHNIDEDLLASLVKAESAGRVRAVSRTGARGLMQLMPGTANELGVKDSFQPEQNIAGGSQYLDQLLTRYHDNVALALAAYNAGPGAVDKYHGVPPYRETQAYVARVIREFNRRKLAARSQVQVASAHGAASAR
jgi:soluble lytic murein transglycosylase-like protein